MSDNPQENSEAEFLPPEDFVPFTQIPTWQVLTPLSPQARAVHDFLWTHVDQSTGQLLAIPSVGSIGEYVGVKEGSVRTYVKELMTAGLIRKVPTYTDRRTGQRTTKEVREDGVKNARTSNSFQLRWLPPEGRMHPGPLNASEWHHPHKIQERIAAEQARQEDPGSPSPQAPPLNTRRGGSTRKNGGNPSSHPPSTHKGGPPQHTEEEEEPRGEDPTNQVGGSDEPKKAKRNTRPDTRGARFLEALVLPDRTRFGTNEISDHYEHVDDLLDSGWTEQGLTAEVTADTGRVDSWRKVARYRITHLRPLAPQSQQGQDAGGGHAPSKPRSKNRLWCRDCDGQTITVDGTRARICSDDCPHAPSTADVAALQQELAAPEQEQPESHGATSSNTGDGADGASLPPEIEKVTGQLAGTLSLNNN